MMPLSAAGLILFVLIQKGFKKIKFAVMQNNERLNQVGLKLAFAEQTLKQQTSLKKSVHLPDSDVWLDFVETAWSIGELH